MRPLPFFVGVLVGLATLSWAGAHVRSAEWTRQFTRFHRLISPEANYFPTVRQIKQIIDDGPQDKMFVIVGGTSVFYGVGQPDQTMWTQYLQSALGERFRVINPPKEAAGQRSRRYRRRNSAAMWHTSGLRSRRHAPSFCNSV